MTPSTSENNQSNFLATIRLFHLALLVGVVMFSALLYFLVRSNSNNTGDSGEFNPVFSLIGPIAGFLSIAAAFFIFRQQLKGCKKQSSLYSKLDHYKKAHIFKLAVLESGAIVNLIFFFLDGNLMLLVFGMLVIVVMAINYPSIYRVSNDLELNDEEVPLLESNSALS